jgi:hypothetical protein
LELFTIGRRRSQRARASRDRTYVERIRLDRLSLVSMDELAGVLGASASIFHPALSKIDMRDDAE